MDNLKFNLFSDFEIRNPFWVASSHLTDSVKAISAFKPYNPSILTLKTTSEILSNQTSDKRRLFETLQSDYALYCEGTKSKEFLDLEKTKQILEYCNQELPNTKIGVSVLLGEDYDHIQEELNGYDFVELNLKYSARIEKDHRNQSFSDYHKNKYSEICREVIKFSDAFNHSTQFIKVTRELPWLTPCKEWFDFIDILSERENNIGLIIANTRKIRIPGTLLEIDLFKKTPTELSEGVLVGSPLFLETYNIIRSLHLKTEKIDSIPIPIIASGGIIGLSETLDILSAGAKGVQLCTALHKERHHYYAWLCGHLNDVIDRFEFSNYDEFLRLLRLEGEVLKSKIISYLRTTNNFKVYVEKKVDSKKQEFKKILIDYIKEGSNDTLNVIENRDKSINDIINRHNLILPIPNIWTELQQAELFETNPEQLKQELSEKKYFVISMLGASISHSIFLKLRDLFIPKLKVDRQDDSMRVIKKIANGKKWDLAVISENYFEILGEQNILREYCPVPLGAICKSKYNLKAFNTHENENITDIYHFGGAQSTKELESLISRNGSLEDVRIQSVAMHQIARILTYPASHIAVFTKDPLSSLYSILCDVELINIDSCYSIQWLIASNSFVENNSPELIGFLLSKIKEILQQQVDAPKETYIILSQDGLQQELIQKLGS